MTLGSDQGQLIRSPCIAWMRIIIIIIIKLVVDGRQRTHSRPGRDVRELSGVLRLGRAERAKRLRDAPRSATRPLVILSTLGSSVSTTQEKNEK